MRLQALGFGVAFVLALVEARVLLTEIDQRWLVLLALGTGAAAARLGVRELSAGSSLAFAAIALVLPWPLFIVLLAAWAWGEGTPFEWLGYSIAVLQLALPVGASALAATRLTEHLPLRPAYAAVLGLTAGVGLSVAAAAPGAEWLDEPPPARFSQIDEGRGAYGPVALGDSKEEMFAAFGARPRAGLNESLTPTGADEFEGPTFVPMRSPDFYRYEDVVFWFEDGEVKGFEVTSPGAETSGAIEVGDDLDEVLEAYPELECGDAPAGDISTYPYCAGRIARERWMWFGGDPVSTIAVSSRGFG